MHPEADSDNLAALNARVGRVLRRFAERDDGNRLLLDVPLAPRTTFRIGGSASGLCRVRTPEEAAEFQGFARDHDLPLFRLGGGSNVLVDDAGFCGLVLSLELDVLDFAPDTVRVGAGVPFDDLIARALDAGRPGFAFASGIPGSLGGALVGNAGCYGHEIGEFLLEATVLRGDGRLETVGVEDFGFAYRHSRFKESGDLVLEAVLRAAPGPVEAARTERTGRLTDRRAKHPVDLPSAGSYFKNLPPAEPGERRRAAGALLDECGARGWSCGDAAVFEKHANIIVNRGAAACRDVLELADRMRRAVEERFGLRLEPEVRHLPRYPARSGFDVDTGAPRPDF